MEKNLLNNNIKIDLFKPVRSYNNADVQKEEICKENKKSGIYRWTHISSGKSYVGSSIILSRRFRQYFNLSYLLREVKTNNSLIYKALLKHGYSNFKLDILEYCDPSNILEREQYYLDNLYLEYNTLKVAGSRLGVKHSVYTKERIRRARLGKSVSEAYKVKLYLQSRPCPLTVINKKTWEVIFFTSIRKTALFIGIHHSYIAKCLIKNTFYEGKGYLVSKCEQKLSIIGY